MRKLTSRYVFGEPLYKRNLTINPGKIVNATYNISKPGYKVVGVAAFGATNSAEGGANSSSCYTYMIQIADQTVNQWVRNVEKETYIATVDLYIIPIYQSN